MPPADTSDVERQLLTAAAARGATVTICGPGHFQIRGLLLVNYYPESKRRTAYIAATTRGLNNATPAQAVAMAFQAPPIAKGDAKAERGGAGRYSRWKKRMWKAGVRLCYWCNEPMTRDASDRDLVMSVDHKIPLARGGLDNPNNWVAAHAKCNHARGHDMPELRSSTTGASGEIR